MKYLLFIILLSSSLCCRKEKINPTDFTDNGNYMTCTIDGVPWTASCEDDPLFGCDPVDCLFFPNSASNGGLGIYAGSNKPFSGITIEKASVLGGINIGQNSLPPQTILTCSNCGKNNSIFFLDTLYEPNKQLIIDSINVETTIIEGKFSFRVISKDYADSIYIENGKFKLNYRN